MTYKTILLHLHDVARAQRLLDVAVPLARHMDAHLIGLNIMPPYVVLPGGELGGAMTVDAHREAYRDDIANLKARFKDATCLLGGKVEWREADANFGSAVATLIEHGRVCDLIIASQRQRTWTLSQYLEEPERVGIESGRPVLVVPNEGKITIPPTRATLAWNGRRESVRAAFDALPLLAGTEEVNIVWVNSDRGALEAGDLPGSDISATLTRHGLKCLASQSYAPNADVGSELLRHAHAFGSDLLVMGVYGHSRMREFILGGASRDVLAGMNRLVLMSH